MVATCVEEAAKAGLLHRAWLLSSEPEAFGKLLDAWESMEYKHQKKHQTAPFMSSEILFPSIAIAAVFDIVTSKVPFLKASTGDASMLGDVLKAFYGDAPNIPDSWYARLWDQRQATYVNWDGSCWTARDQTEAGSYFDEGRRDVHRLLAGLRRDLRRTMSDPDPGSFFEELAGPTR
jgi:hypothetical protein